MGFSARGWLKINLPFSLYPAPSIPAKFSRASNLCTISSSASSPCPFTTTSTYGAASVWCGSSDGCHPPSTTGTSGYSRLVSRAISTVSRIIGPVTSDTHRHSASASSSITLFLKFGVMVESIMRTSYPARSSGVATARMPKGAVASVLVNAGKKKTTFLDRGRIEKNPAERCFRPYVHTNLIAQDRILVTHFGLRSSFPFRAILYPFGFPVAVSSHSEAVVAIAHAEWDQWQQAFDDPPIELTFEVAPHRGSPDRPPASSFQA